MASSTREGADEETGLYYPGARYYAAWLGRWTSADPLGIGAGRAGAGSLERGIAHRCTATPAAPTPSTTRPPPWRRA
ncbi:MAG: hypothetical protein IPM79_39265 [Polyangiaceae bacterium]|nr:hypothetical protein [Polyangiaceae bacterium]